MKRPKLTRRRWLAIGGASLLLRRPLAAQTASVQGPTPAPFESLRPLIDARRDRFAEEAAAMARPSLVKPERPRQTWFADISGHVLHDEQLSKGSPYWVSRLDPATGIDLYGNNGIAVGDVDQDGQEEIFVCQPGGLPNKLLRWKDGQLEDVAPQSGLDLLDDTSSALFLDLRNLGRQDLIVLRSAGPELFLNDGRGKFTHRPKAFHFERPAQGSFTGMAAADYDRDGKLDVYLCCYSFFQSEAQYRYPAPYHDAQNGPPNFLFRNRLNPDGSGGFEDVTRSSGLDENNNRFSFAPAWCDYDGSGWPSLYVANDFGRNNLYRNREGSFRDVAAEAGVQDMGPGMSACWFDEDGDGRPDLYVANMWTESGKRVVGSEQFPHRGDAALQEAYRRHTKGNSFYRNTGTGKFDDRGAQLGLEKGLWAWAADACDFDNDGQPEIYVAAGMITGNREPDLMSFFWRRVVAQGPATATAASGYEDGWNAINQFVREGYSWNGNEANVFFRKRDGRYEDASAEAGLDIASDSRAFAFADIDGDGCVDLLLKSRLGPQLRVLSNRVGRLKPRIALELEGVRSNRDAIGARVEVDGQSKWISAGSGYLSQHTKRVYFGLPQGGPARLVRIQWPSGERQEFSGLAAGRVWKIREGDSPVAGKEFSPGFEQKALELPGDNSMGLADTWFYEPIPLPEPAQGPGLLFLHTGQTVPAGAFGIDLKPDATRYGAWSLFRRYLFEYRAALDLPLSLLLNRAGKAIKVYAKTPSAGQVARDLSAPDLSDPKPSALPYRGAYLQTPRRDHFKMGAAMLWSGYAAQALPYLEEVATAQPANARIWTYIGRVHLKLQQLDPAQRALQRALALDDSQAEAWNELGGVELARGRQLQALGHYEQALQRKPDLFYCLLNAGQCASQLGQTAKSAEFYRRALAVEPLSPEAANGLGLALAQLGQSAEAKQWLQKAIELRRDYAEAINNLAVLYLQLGQNTDAVNALRYGIEVSPQSELLYLNLSRIYVQRGERPMALQIMRQLLDVVPSSETAKKALRDLGI